MGEATIGFSDFEALGFDEGLFDDAAGGSTLRTSNEGFQIDKPALFSITISCEHMNTNVKCKYAQWVW